MFLDDKGQASAEFIFVTLIAVIVIGSLVSVIGSNQAKTQGGGCWRCHSNGTKNC